MLTMRDHGVEDYAVLPHMDTTDVGVLGDDDRACLEELGAYLATTDAWKRFAIWLLHKHFHPAAGEVFVEHATHAPRGTWTAPADRSADLSAIAIRFGDPDSNEIVGMEFVAIEDFGDVAPLSDDDSEVLAGIAERLGAHGKIDRFGVRLIRNPLALTDNELLHETCDSQTRTLQCAVGERDALLGDEDTTETTWRWKVVDGTAQPTVMQDCLVVCVRAGEGHTVAHRSEPDGYPASF
jgi:hypothetical protein